MTGNPEKHKRLSLRLKGYDYSAAGAYFVTICTHNRAALFGEIQNGIMMENVLGEIVRDEWNKSGEIRKEITLDAFAIMPNHIHGIVIISVGATGRSPLQPLLPCDKKIPPGPTRKSIGAFVAGFKSAVTARINTIRSRPGIPVWQRNYYEHVMRHDDDLNSIREYIINNPLKWDLDSDNPLNKGIYGRGDRPVAPTVNQCPKG